MKPLVLFGILAAGCTIVTPANDGGPMPTPFPSPVPTGPPPPPPLHAHILFVANLHRSSVNLAPHYAALMTALPSRIESLGLRIDRWAVAPTFAGPDGPRLVLGGKDALPEGGMLATRLAQFAESGAFDGDGETAESGNLVRLGREIGRAALPPGGGGIERDTFFDQPRNLFIVVSFESLGRRCGLSDPACAVDGRAPDAVFTAAEADGTASWLRFLKGGLRLSQVVHVAVATREGEAVDAFRARCREVPGFPVNLFDVIEPSAHVYFDPLLAALGAANPGTGQQADLCDLLGSDTDLAVRSLAIAIASLAR